METNNIDSTIKMRDVAKEGLTVKLTVKVKGTFIVDLGLWIAKLGIWISGASCEVIENKTEVK
ncbi:MAG: hypothetical protein ABFD07_11490 [Methanobacterium sp.]